MNQLIRLLIALIILSGLRQTSAQVSFAVATNYNLKGSLYFGLAADVNGSGYLDLIMAKSNTMVILTNDGKGIFGSNAALTFGSLPYCAVAADVNGGPLAAK